MRGSSAGLVACTVAAFAVGCATAPAAEPAHSAPTATRTVHTGQSDIAADGPLGVRVRPGCQATTAGPGGRTVVITLAGNGKRYCVRVGDRLRVSLPARGTSRWQQPLVSGGAVVTAPGAASTPARATLGSFTAARPGQVTMTSVLPPCQYTVPLRKNAFEPADPLPTTQLRRVCPPGHHFSALIIVLR
ncbi:MAG: hypothetical protein LBV78_12145 [Kitasatospora sp.]|jgi:hypothetical protein|nr:hypothetical protein [Kitasatospora sp.]